MFKEHTPLRHGFFKLLDMKVRYDKEVDAMYIYAQEGQSEYSEEIGEGIIIDF